MKLKLQTISPLHIGTGNLLEPFEYVVDENRYYRLDQNKTFQIALKRYPDFPEKYSAWVEKKSDALRKARKNNKLQSEIRKEFNFKYFCENILNDAELFREIKEKAVAYTAELPYGLQNKKQISELLKTAGNEPYIPGTSVKGAIRTVLAWRALKNMNSTEKNELFNEILNSRNFQKFKGRSLDDVIMEKIFICGKKIGGKTDFSDIKLDILKFLKVSDALPVDVKMSVYPANLYLTNKPPQTQTPALETIEFNSVFEFEINVNEKEIRKIFEISIGNASRVWLEFDKKFKKIFGFYPSEINVDSLEEAMVRSVMEAAEDFTSALFRREKKWTDKFKNTLVEKGEERKNADISSVKEFFDVYSEIPIVLKIGWASGFQATTLFDALETDEAGRAFLKKVFERFKIGIPQNKKKDPNVSMPDISNFPKSRRLVSQKVAYPVDPLGWVALLEEDQVLELE